MKKQTLKLTITPRAKQYFTYATTLCILAALLFAGVGNVWARPMLAVAPSLGTAASFAVLAGSTATNTGSTNIVGSLGVSPGSAITGFPPGLVTDGTTHTNDAVAIQAQNDVTTAYNNLAGQACDVNLTSQDLGGMTLTPGVYCFPDTSAQLTGALTLDGQGDPDAVFVFQIGSTLTTASDSFVLTVNGAASCNVFWQVGSSATFGTSTAFSGNVLALASISLNTSATLFGRALARTGAVTMDDNEISRNCTIASPTNTPAPSDSTATPTNTPIGEPGQATSTPTPEGGPGQATSTPTPVVTPTPFSTQAPTALDPVGQPSDNTSTLYLPFNVK